MSKVALEVAEAEFERWAQSFELDVSGQGFDDEEMKDLKRFKSKFVARMQSGALVIDEDGTIEFTPRGQSAPLTFEEPDGSVLSARMKTDNDVQASRRILAAWAKVEPKAFADMKLRDVNFCSELLAFFGNS